MQLNPIGIGEIKINSNVVTNVNAIKTIEIIGVSWEAIVIIAC